MVLALKRWTVEGVVLALAVLTLLMILARPSLAFQDAEATMTFSQSALRTGPSLTWRDSVLALNSTRLDGASRPRVISYFAYIVALKTRLWLWQFVTPHPSFSPMWLLTLVVAPLLLFRTLRRVAGARAAAVGVSLYLLSPGCLSGGLFFFHPAKPLTAVLVIVMWSLCVRIAEEGTCAHCGTPTAGGRRWRVVACLIALAPFVDETAVFVACVPVVWLWPYFRPSGGRRALRNWSWIAAPLIGAIVTILVVAPTVSSVAVGHRFDMVGDFRDATHWQRLNVTHVLWQISAQFGAQLVPWSSSHMRVPVAEGASVWWQAWLAIAALAGVIRFALTSSTLAPSICRVVWLCVLCVVLQTVVFVVHDFELVASSFYYGSSFSVWFALLAALLYARFASRADRGRTALGRLVVVGVCAVGVVNTLQMADSWRHHEAAKQMIYAKFAPPDPVEWLANWRPMMAQAGAFFAGPPFALDDTRQSYAPTSTALGWREARQIWQRWRAGASDILDGQPVDVANVWLVRELELARAARAGTARRPIFQ